MCIKPSLQLYFANAEWAMPLASRTSSCLRRACSWRGSANEVRPLENLAAWLSFQDVADIVILPEGECPTCGTPVYNLAAEQCLALAIAAIGPNIHDY